MLDFAIFQCFVCQNECKVLSIRGINNKSGILVHDVYWAIDRDSDGTVNYEEIVLYFEMDKTHHSGEVFARRIFGIMDVNGNGTVDFLEFTAAVWNFCALDDDDLLRFAFYLYSSPVSGDGKGRVLDDHSCELMVAELFGWNWKASSNARRVREKLRDFLSLCKVDVDADVFVDFFRSSTIYGLLLFERVRSQTTYL